MPWHSCMQWGDMGHGGRTGLEQRRCHLLCVNRDSHLFWGYDLPSSLPCRAATDLHRQVLAPVFCLLCGCCHARLECGDIIPASYFCRSVLMAQGLGVPVIYLWRCACSTPSLRQSPSSAVCSRTVSSTIKTPSLSSLWLFPEKRRCKSFLTQGYWHRECGWNGEEISGGGGWWQGNSHLCFKQIFWIPDRKWNNAAIWTAPWLSYPQVQSSEIFFQKASDDKNLQVQRKIYKGHKPKLHRFYKWTLAVIKMFWLCNRIRICSFAKTWMQGLCGGDSVTVRAGGAVWHRGLLTWAELPCTSVCTGGYGGEPYTLLWFLLLCHWNPNWWIF